MMRARPSVASGWRIDVAQAFELPQKVVGCLLGEARGHGDITRPALVDALEPEEGDHRPGDMWVAGRVDEGEHLLAGEVVSDTKPTHEARRPLLRSWD
jgi:hypothetical protein